MGRNNEVQCACGFYPGCIPFRAAWLYHNNVLSASSYSIVSTL